MRPVSRRICDVLSHHVTLIMDEVLRHKFERWTNKTPSCWLWTGSKNDKGYGQVRVNNKVRYVHRLAFEAANGPLRPGACVLHRCDTPLCVRPDHLFIGDRKSNSCDAVFKNRTAIGPRNGRRPKFTPSPETRAHMLDLAWFGCSAKDLSDAYYAKIDYCREMVRRAFGR